jgi:hypothetical protein
LGDGQRIAEKLLQFKTFLHKKVIFFARTLFVSRVITRSFSTTYGGGTGAGRNSLVFSELQPFALVHCGR